MFKKANYIYTIYTEGSFTKAAGKLFISQPCLSAAVKRTEQLVGGALFERSGSGIRLTELGVEYIRTAEQILELERQFSCKAKDIHGLSRGTVRVGGSNYVCSYILPRIIERFALRYPNIMVLLTEADSSKLNELLEEGTLDLVVDSFDGEPQGRDFRILLREKILLAVPAQLECNRLLADRSITPSALFETPEKGGRLPAVPAENFARERFILLKAGHSMHRHAMEIFRHAGFIPQVGLLLDQLSTSYSMCAQGGGCCFVTDTVFRYHHFDDGVRLYNVTGSGSRILAIVGKQRGYLQPAQKAFTEIAVEAIQ